MLGRQFYRNVASYMTWDFKNKNIPHFRALRLIELRKSVGLWLGDYDVQM